MTNEKPKKIRLSHSLINYWERGDVQGAINCYFHVDKGATKQMEAGKKYHEEIADCITKRNMLPDYMDFNGKFLTPKPEHAVVVSYNELFDLKGVFDCLDEPYLYEFKTGVSDSLEWTRTQQIPLYFLICEIAQIGVDLAYVIRHNQYQKETDYTIVHNSKRLVEQARNVIDTVGPELHQYFLDQGLI